MKSKSLIAVAAIAFVFSVPAAADTIQMPASVTVAATKDAAGNAIIEWNDPLKVAAIEHYIGHGKKGGFVNKIQVGAEKKAVLKDVVKNGGRFNVATPDGKYLHLECGGNDKTTMPTFKGLKVDCSYTDPVSGQKVGALVVQ